MTLAIAAMAVDGLVLASDSRLSGGPDVTADTSEKFFQVNRDIGAMTFGLAQPGYEGLTRLVEDVKRKPDLTSFPQIVAHAKDVFSQAFKKFATGTAPQPQHALGFVVAGYDSVRTNRFRIASFSSPGFDPTETNALNLPFLVAGQWFLAQYVLNKIYYPEVTVSILKDMVIFSIQETMTIHDTVGGPLNLAIVDRSQGFQRVQEQAIREIMIRNQSRFVRWKELLSSVIERPGRKEG